MWVSSWTITSSSQSSLNRSPACSLGGVAKMTMRFVGETMA